MSSKQRKLNTNQTPANDGLAENGLFSGGPNLQKESASNRPPAHTNDDSFKSYRDLHPKINLTWLVASTHLKNISQIGNLPQLGVKIKNVWNHRL